MSVIGSCCNALKEKYKFYQGDMSELQESFTYKSE